MSHFFKALAPGFSTPLILVQHLAPEVGDTHIKHFQRQTPLEVIEPSPGMAIQPGRVYVAPPNYHLLVETDKTFSLNVDPPMNYVRPAADILFETAADAFGPALIGIVLTGANNDGALGLAAIHFHGGITMVQDPEEAPFATMPESALEFIQPDFVLPVKDLALTLNMLCPDVRSAA